MVESQIYKKEKDYTSILSTNTPLLPELYNDNISIELKSEQTLNGKQYLLAIPITKFFSNLRNLYILIHILNGDSVISLRLIEYFVVNYVLENNTYFNMNKYNTNKTYIISNLFNKYPNNTNTNTNTNNLKDEIIDDITSKISNSFNTFTTSSNTTSSNTTSSNTTNKDNELSNFDDFFMIHDNYKCQLKEYNKKNFDPFCRWTRIRFYYTKQKYFFTTIAQLNFFKWMIENYIIDYILDNLSTIEKSMIAYEKKIKNDKLLKYNEEEITISDHFDIQEIDNAKYKIDDTLQKGMYLDNNIIDINNNISQLKNSKTKKKEIHMTNYDKKTKLKCRKKKEFTKTNRSILKYNCSKVISFD